MHGYTALYKCLRYYYLLLLNKNIIFSFVGDESNIEYLDGDSFVYEVEGLPDSDPDDEFYPNAKKPSRVKFSSSPIKVGPHKLSTESMCLAHCPSIPLSVLPVYAMI